MTSFTMTSFLMSENDYVPVPNFVIFVLAALIIIYRYCTSTFRHFDKFGILCEPPWPLIGNLPSMAKYGYYNDSVLVQKYGKLLGFFIGRTPVLIVADPEWVKEVMVREFSSFMDRSSSEGLNVDHDTSKGLLMITGDEWRRVRSVLSPAFTSNKLKSMISDMVVRADGLCEEIQQLVHDNKEFDARIVAGNFSMSVVASSFFGVEINSGAPSQPQSLFAHQATRIFDSINFASPKIMLLMMMPSIAAPIYRYFGIGLFDAEALRFFREQITEMIALRKESTTCHRQDVLQLMLEAHDLADDNSESKKPDTKKPLTSLEILGNSLTFLMAGYETTATALAFVLYELVLHQNVQQKLYEQIKLKMTEHQDSICQELLNDLPYLDQVINETMRLYPAAGRADRLCTEDCQIGPYPVTKGSALFVSIWALHHDPDYWPNPEHFDPERFAPENNHLLTPYTFLPFGLGPRSCIGMRMAIMEIKIALISLLCKFNFEQSEKTEIPLELAVTGHLTGAKNGVFMRAVRRNHV